MKYFIYIYMCMRVLGWYYVCMCVRWLLFSYNYNKSIQSQQQHQPSFVIRGALWRIPIIFPSTTNWPQWCLRLKNNCDIWKFISVHLRATYILNKLFPDNEKEKTFLTFKWIPFFPISILFSFSLDMNKIYTAEIELIIFIRSVPYELLNLRQASVIYIILSPLVYQLEHKWSCSFQ